MYKRTESTSDTTAEYYLKNLGIVDLTTGNWSWYVNRADRVAKVVPRSYQQPDSISANMGVDSNHVDASFYLYDHLGNTRVVYTPTVRMGCTVLDYTLEYAADYYPYGKILRQYANGEVEKYLTTQHERDQETGLDYRGARFYDSDIARFLSLDPLAASYPSLSDYSYVAGNPISFIDPSGKAAEGHWYGLDGTYYGDDKRGDDNVYINRLGDMFGRSAVQMRNDYEKDLVKFGEAPWANKLNVSNYEFLTIANILDHESVLNNPQELLWMAHTSNNAAKQKGKSMYGLLMTGYSSVNAEDKVPQSTSNSVGNKSCRAGVISALTGAPDPTGGATKWDGTDFIAWGLNSPNGTPQNKFEEYDVIYIPHAIFDQHVLNVSQRYTNGYVPYSGVKYQYPAAVFTVPENHFNNGSFIYDSPYSNNGETLQATGAFGLSIFWKILN